MRKRSINYIKYADGTMAVRIYFFLTLTCYVVSEQAHGIHFQ